jgi:hypothetical protein
MIGVAVAGLLAAAAGLFAAVAFSAGPNQATLTTTVDVAAEGATGPAGPKGAAGPTGPQGAAGTTDCPDGFAIGEVVFIQQGKGPTTLYVCVKQ